MITLSKGAGIPPFSQIDGDWRLPVGTCGSSYTRWSPTGRIIADMLYHIGEMHPVLRAEQYIVMPDHVHILLLVQFTSGGNFILITNRPLAEREKPYVISFAIREGCRFGAIVAYTGVGFCVAVRYE